MVSNNFSVSRILALDGVRGIAFLMVFFCHLGILQTGQFGVDLFFVLSGFLITSILLQEKRRNGSISIPKFYLRRALRLLPALFACVIGVLIFSLIMQPYAKIMATLSDLWHVVLYIHNWYLSADWHLIDFKQLTLDQVVARHQEMYVHLWSLSVEEQFYIVWPCLLIIMLKMPRSIVLSLLLIGMIVPAIARWMLWHDGSALWIYFRTDLRFDNLLYGALIAWMLHWGYAPEGLSRKILSWAGVLSLFGLIGIAIPDLLSHGEVYHGIFSIVALFSALLIASTVWCPLPLLKWFLELKPLTWIGKVSYGLYLWHWPVVLMVSRMPMPNKFLADFTIIGLTLTIVSISYYKLELPFLKLKDRVGHTKQPSSSEDSPQLEATSLA